MPPRTGRPRNASHDFVNAQFLEQLHPPATPSPAGSSNLTPVPEMMQGEQPFEAQGYDQGYADAELQSEIRPPVERPFIPDLDISMIGDPRFKAHFKGSLAKLAMEAAPGAKLEDEAAELLLYVANDFLGNLANFSCRLASHRGAENLGAEDVALYLEQMHGMHISLAPAPSPPPPEEPINARVEPGAPGAPSPTQIREPSPPLAKSRPRRHTNTAPPEVAQEEEEEEGEEEEEEGDGTEENVDEGETDEEKPRESRRLRERAIAAEKVKQKKRGKVGRPRK